MHPILKQLLENYRLAIEQQIAQLSENAIAQITVSESEIEHAQTNTEHKREYSYYALIASTNDGIFISPVAGEQHHEDGTITGWICLLRDYLEPFAHVCASYPDDELIRGLNEITAVNAVSRIYNDEVYDAGLEFEDADTLQGGTVLEKVAFTLTDRFQPRSTVVYEYFELNDTRTTWRKYHCSYIIITRAELAGLYSSVDL